MLLLTRLPPLRSENKGGNNRPYEVKTKNRVLSFLHYNKMSAVNGYNELPQIVQTVQKEPT